MDKKIVETFATHARRDLIGAVKLRLELISITDKGAEEKLPSSTAEAEFYAGNPAHPLIGSDITRRRAIISRLEDRKDGKSWSEAFSELTEEAAYTWFNRIIALRFMEVNDYLPSGTRVLSSIRGTAEPDIMTDARGIEDALGGYSGDELALIDRAWDTQAPAAMDDLYQMLFLKQVNALSKNLPSLFEPTKDYLQLLFTPNYHSGVIKDLVTNVPEADFDVGDSGQGQVEVIGWLYQYYNEEPHNRVVNINGGAVKEADIPAATQLFTTDWVVRYMVDNSLGRYYLEHSENSGLASTLHYLIPGKLHSVSKSVELSQLRVLDNAMGSGHILVYAFDVLMAIYEENGFVKREAARKIVQNNLFGLEIDKRAFQLAYFAIMMKLRQYDRHALDGNIQPNLYEFESSANLTDDVIDQLDLSSESKRDLTEIRDEFINAKSLGSIIELSKTYDTKSIRNGMGEQDSDAVSLFVGESIRSQIFRMLSVIDVLQATYDVVVTNPPYLNKMDKPLKAYVKKHYKAYSGDLFSVFIWLNIGMTKPNGYAAYMTPMVWMFIKTYQALRTSVLGTKRISSLIQMEYSAFEEATVPINTFVLQNSHENLVGSYIRLSDFKGGMGVQREKTLKAIQNPDVSYFYRTNQANFGKIPGSPIAYWASSELIHDFEVGRPLAEIVEARNGITTGENSKFLRQWYEVGFEDVYLNAHNSSEAEASGKTWFPYNKGGAYRKWYGNYDYVVNWKDDGFALKHNFWRDGQLRSVLRSP
ncbi:BREX-1 system adenine-specific DNA-methyltransferase PglX, partial [Lacticaseibacillus camelliae]